MQTRTRPMETPAPESPSRRTPGIALIVGALVATLVVGSLAGYAARRPETKVVTQTHTVTETETVEQTPQSCIDALRGLTSSYQAQARAYKIASNLALLGTLGPTGADGRVDEMIRLAGVANDRLEDVQANVEDCGASA